MKAAFTTRSVPPASSGMSICRTPSSVGLDVQAVWRRRQRDLQDGGAEARTDAAFAAKIVAPLDIWDVDQVRRCCSQGRDQSFAFAAMGCRP